MLEEKLEQRTRHPKVAPQWFTVLELDEALHAQEGVRQTCERLFTQGHTLGLFCIVIAREKTASTLSLAIVSCTINTNHQIPLASRRPNAHSATLARRASTNACVSIGISHIDPWRLRKKLHQLDLELGSAPGRAADGT